ncbi:response regulator transcription factor [Granulicatella sp. 19428wC4_WM01]|nr:response regulator transcription factor [Granulicatella sp. 19428wC4_WM01]TFU96428.1 response regulator transcription factor [Granulicatella sp. WM01]
MYKILIIEDDAIIAKSIASYLEKWSFQVKIVEQFNQIMDEIVSFSPDLVLLDIHLPYYDGYYFCEEIRRVSKVPILFISSASDEMNIVMAINVGGDDFIQKPFKLMVLKAKIDALLRRVYDFQLNQTILMHKEVYFDTSKDSVSYCHQSLELTKNEARILYYLLDHKETIVTRDELMRFLWETEQFVDENTLSVNVNRLRSKLGSIGIVDFIQTKKGRGYMV